MTTLTQDIDDLVALRLGDPHRILGAHPGPDGEIVVRTYRPAAAARRGAARGRAARRAAPDPSRRVFEGEVPGGELPLRYELDVSYPDGSTYAIRDPYAFPPTLGDLDLHLAGEGRHEELYGKLGAHLARAPRRAGTASRSGRPARAASASSATSTPGTGACTRCARSARPASGSCSSPASRRARATSSRSAAPTASSRLQADPFAFRTEVPPPTASIVHARTTSGRTRSG